MSDADREAMLELVAAYALGVLPQSELGHVSAFILSNPEARREYEDLRGASSLIGLIAEEPVDTARALRMKERIMAGVRDDANAPATPRRAVVPITRSRALWATALAAAAAFVFAIQNLGLQSSLHEAQNRVVALQAQMAGERAHVARDDRMLADMTAPDAKRYAVAYGTVVRRGTHVYLALTSLPTVPRGRVYQAWTLTRGAKTVAPSVTFTPNVAGITLVPLPEDATKLAAVALSVEPDGGSRAPTTKPAFTQPLT